MALNENELKDFRNTVSELRDTVEEQVKPLREKVGEMPADVEAKMDRLTERIADLETKKNRREKSGGEVDSGMSDGRKAFTKWLQNKALSDDEVEALNKSAPDIEERKDLSIGTGGNQSDSLAPAEFVQEIIKDAVEISPFRQVARVRSTTRKEAEFPKLQGRPNAAFVSETGTRTDDTSTDFGGEDDLVIIPTHEFYVNVPVTRQMLEDSVFDVEAEVREVVATEMSQLQGNKFLQGTGTGEPQGLLTSGDFSATAATPDTASNDITDLQAEDIRKLPYRLKQQYRNNASFGVTREALREIMTLEDSQGQFLFQPMLSGDVPSNILGFQFTEMQDLTDGTASTGDVPVTFGDYNRAYYVLDRLAMEVIRDPYSAKKQGKIEYHFRGRVGGDLVLGEAVNGVSIP